MGIALILVSVSIFGASVTLTAQQERLVHVVQIDSHEARYSYIPSRLSPYQFAELIQVGPARDPDLVPPQLELCIEDDADYLPCGDRTLGSPNFLRNADINIRKGRAILTRLEQLKVPPSLALALGHYRRGTSFWLCLERARLAYYRGDNNALRAQCDAVSAEMRCPDAVKQAAAAQTPTDRTQVATYAWHNCMNSAFYESYGKYPLESWRGFLKAFDIQETIIAIP